MSLEYRVGDVFDRLAEIPDNSIDLIVTSPPFLALRSYLPADHPDKHKEIGSEPTPAEFIGTLLALSAEWGRVLAPHGSICVELGDTFSGSGGSGGDYSTGLREGQEKFKGSALADRKNKVLNANGQRMQQGNGWPLAKSLTGIPTLYPWSLAYGRNLLTGEPSPAGQWRIRNVIVWARPNPPVGALGDKFRPATSYITVACKGPKRYFDLDAVRTEPTSGDAGSMKSNAGRGREGFRGVTDGGTDHPSLVSNPAGAPPLDWHTDEHPEDGDWLWKLSTQPYAGKVPSIAWVPIDRSEAEAAGAHADDIRRTASPSCLRHGDLPGQVPKALRDAHAAGSSSRTSRSADHPDGEQLPGFVPTGQTPERSTARQELCLEDDPAATPHSSPSRRTDRAPATTQPDTPSARTTRSTARKSASPASSAPSLGTDESSISAVDSLAIPSSRTTPDTADIPTPDEIPCTCSFHKRTTEYSSHYATYPFALPKRLIEAMCPQRVCVECGKASERIVDVGYVTDRGEVAEPGKWDSQSTSGRGARSGKNSGPNGRQVMVSNNTTTGWTDCGHDAWRTGVVLDPFAGSGTTLEAAQALGRHAIGIDLDARNAHLAQQRVGMFLEVIGDAA